MMCRVLFILLLLTGVSVAELPKELKQATERVVLTLTVEPLHLGPGLRSLELWIQPYPREPHVTLGDAPLSADTRITPEQATRLLARLEQGGFFEAAGFHFVGAGPAPPGATALEEAERELHGKPNATVLVRYRQGDQFRYYRQVHTWSDEVEKLFREFGKVVATEEVSKLIATARGEVQ